MIVFLGYSHIVLTIIIYLYLFDFNIIAIFFVGLGSILPDIDSPKSLLGRYNFFAFLMHHRGFCHTIPFAALVYGLLLLTPLPNVYRLDVVFGIMVHLIMDTVNPSGIMWLYPATRKRFSLKLFSVGSPEEIMLLAIGSLYLFTQYKP